MARDHGYKVGDEVMQIFRRHFSELPHAVWRGQVVKALKTKIEVHWMHEEVPREYTGFRNITECVTPFDNEKYQIARLGVANARYRSNIQKKLQNINHSDYVYAPTEFEALKKQNEELANIFHLVTSFAETGIKKNKSTW